MFRSIATILELTEKSRGKKGTPTIKEARQSRASHEGRRHIGLHDGSSSKGSWQRAGTRSWTKAAIVDGGPNVQ